MPKCQDFSIQHIDLQRLLGLLADLRPRGHGLAQHVAGAQLRDLQGPCWDGTAELLGKNGWQMEKMLAWDDISPESLVEC